MRNAWKMLLSALFVLSSAAGCTSTESNTYTQIPMAEAKVRFETEENVMIVDVRTAEEYESGHIPGAVNLPNESIGTVMPEVLPDTEQTIYVYCRSGNRSRQAAEKLAAMGYTSIVECGGIIDWTGDLE